MPLTEKSLEELFKEFASKKPTPGGGSAAALAGSLAAALVEMVGKLTDTETAKAITKEAVNIRLRLTKLIDEDGEAFKAFMKAPADKKQETLNHATLVPLETAELSYRILELANEIARNGNKNAITDAGMASLLADTAIRGAQLNVRINLRSIKDGKFRKWIVERLKRFSDSLDKSQATMKYISEQL